MSFGPNNTTKTATNNLGGVSNEALNNLFPEVTALAKPQIAAGNQNINSGTNFLNTVLNGNRANTTALLQPNIDQIRQGTTNNLQAINTLMPRGGGRSSTLFGASFAPQGQIQNLFSTARTGAATALPQIGLGQVNSGTNLFGVGNQALSTAGGVNANLANIGQTQQQISNNLAMGLGKGIFGLATTPFGGGSATGGLLGLLGQHS